jgi:type II secretory pathway pseudopilin PulG
MELELKTPPAEHGFSMIEALIASLLMVIIVLALVPLFARSMQNTLAGREYSVATQHGRSRSDQYYQLPLTGEELVLPNGSGQLVQPDWWDSASHLWTASAPSATSPWRRTTTVRQYNVNDLLVSGELVTPLAGGTPAPQVHLREVIVEVESTREGGAAGGGRSVTLTTVRGF